MGVEVHCVASGKILKEAMETQQLPPRSERTLAWHRENDPKTPSMAAVWRMLANDYGVTQPSIADRVKNGESAEIGEYDETKNAFPVWAHVIGAAYPEKYWFDLPPKN